VKALRLLALAAAVSICAPAAQACGYKPKRLTIDQIHAASDVIVRGQFTYTVREEKGLHFGDPDWLVGKIEPRKIKKGASADTYQIRHVVAQFYCSGAGWEPDADHPQPSYTGDFYLRRNADNSYVILGYQP
jgi:hypothetical protein